MLLIANFLIGFAVILGSLFIVGITRGNKVTQKTWVILWSIISFSFTLFLIVAAILENEIILNYALGGSVGYVTAVSIHTLDHALKEFRKINNH
jgi:TctA family transporter